MTFLLLLLLLLTVDIGVRPAYPVHAQTDIEPAHTYGSYLGGRSDDRFRAITTDTQGNIYLAGSTYSTDFPGVTGKQESSEDIVIVSFDASGTTLRWAKTLGGSGTDQAFGIALDQHNHLWITGLTDSTDFPVSAGGSTFAGYYDVVLTELDSGTGAVLYSNLFGGTSSDQGNAIVVAPNGLLYITGQASDEFGFRDVLAMSFNPETHTPGNMVRFGRERGEDIGNALAVDRDSNIYITGKTEPQGQDTDFPLVQPFQTQCGVGDGFGDCGEDAFITKLDPALEIILYSTYLGGSYN
ncbi:MAG: SBBP repeat-containing protein, partial [Caldilineaceae bacterium]|nr:SBBP repeat-containing protein [Caldilineaceae bacterium]